MSRVSAAVALCFLFVLCGTAHLGAQDFSGTIQGTIKDKSGAPIAGVTVYLSSPAMLGVQIIMIEESGSFDFPSLAPGTYAVTAEMPGFQTLVRERIILRAGMSYIFHLQMNASEEEVRVIDQTPLPALNLVSSKTAEITDPDMIRHIPLTRDLTHILDLVPGVVSNGFYPDEAMSVLGGTVRDNAFVLDGTKLTDIFTQAPAVHPHIDLMEEIEIISTGQPASEPGAGGAYVNVLSKSGGNSFTGQLGIFFINNGWNQDLWSSPRIRELGVTPPTGDEGLFEPAFNLGGPFWEDRAWFFLDGRYFWKSQVNNFVGPFQDARGGRHDSYNWTRKDYSGFFKLSVRPIATAKFTAWVNLADISQPVSEEPSPRLPFLSTHILDHEKTFAVHGILDYNLSQNALGFVRGAYVKRNIPSLLQTGARSLPWTDDGGDLYGPLSGADYNSNTKRERIQADASVRLFADRFLGSWHTFNMGADFEYSLSNLDWWRQDNMLWYLDSRNPNDYFYADRGLLSFWLCGAAQNSTVLKSESQRIGVYVTDSFSVTPRLTFNLGLRFERSWGWFPVSSKNLSGNGLSLFIGDAVVRPYLLENFPDVFPEGFNPWNPFVAPEMKGIISWNALSPRAGFAYDLLGDGKTVLKASYARYPDELSHRYFLPLHPLYPQNFPIYWLDANGDGQPDVEDEFSLSNLDYRFFSAAFTKQRVAKGLKAPVTEEISISLEREILKDFSLGLHLVSRAQSNILEDALYDPDTGEYWYAMDQAAAQRNWIPFTTTVPGTDSYPSQTVTLYVKSLQAPPAFLQLRNVPELKRKYRALEFSFHKRMAQGWQAAGSLVLSKTEGNIGGSAGQTTALTEAANTPNSFINSYGRIDTDRPLQIKLLGTKELPFGFFLSASFLYQSGRPWQRWAQVLPPADWSATHNAERIYYTVNLEAPGSRREKAWSSLDLRLEKEWKLGAASQLGLYVDFANLLGNTASLVGLNDVALWAPAAEGAGQSGLKTLQPDYGITSAVFGRRTVRLGLRLDF